MKAHQSWEESQNQSPFQLSEIYQISIEEQQLEQGLTNADFLYPIGKDAQIDNARVDVESLVNPRNVNKNALPNFSCSSKTITTSNESAPSAWHNPTKLLRNDLDEMTKKFYDLQSELNVTKQSLEAEKVTSTRLRQELFESTSAVGKLECLLTDHNICVGQTSDQISSSTTTATAAATTTTTVITTSSTRESTHDDNIAFGALQLEYSNCKELVSNLSQCLSEQQENFSIKILDLTNRVNLSEMKLEDEASANVELERKLDIAERSIEKLSKRLKESQDQLLATTAHHELSLLALSSQGNIYSNTLCDNIDLSIASLELKERELFQVSQC